MALVGRKTSPDLVLASTDNEPGIVLLECRRIESDVVLVALGVRYRDVRDPVSLRRCVAERRGRRCPR
jgi:hypothetical protein